MFSKRKRNTLRFSRPVNVPAFLRAFGCLHFVKTSEGAQKGRAWQLSTLVDDKMSRYC
jgi:hypothetical protein